MQGLTPSTRRSVRGGFLACAVLTLAFPVACTMSGGKRADPLLGTWQSTEIASAEMEGYDSVVATFDPAGTVHWIATGPGNLRKVLDFSYRAVEGVLHFEFAHEETSVPYTYRVDESRLELIALGHWARFTFRRVPD